MAKYSGKIGYITTYEESPGKWKPRNIERTCIGDMLANTKRTDSSDGIIDGISLNSRISFVADNFAFENYAYIAYATYMGVKWKVTSVSVEMPRLVLTLGGRYNG